MKRPGERASHAESLLGDWLDFFNGKSVKPGGNGSSPVFGSNGIIGETDSPLSENGIIIGRVGAYCGSVVYCPGRFTASDNTIVARPKGQNADLCYFYYLLTELRLNRYAGGSAQPLLTQSRLNALRVVIPSRTTQQKIAAILHAYDELIENNSRRIEVLEEMARRIYEEWFVDFRCPGHGEAKLVKSSIGVAPEGWEVRAFSDVADFVNGFAFKPSDWGRTGKPIIKITELKNGVTDSTPFFEGGGLLEKYNVKPGDLLFSWSADLEAYIWAHEEGYLNQHLFKVSPNEECGLPFLYFSLRRAMPRFRSLSLGTTMRHIKRSALSQVYLLVPPTEISHAFNTVVEPFIRMRLKLTRMNLVLRRSRELLLPKLVSGDLDVSDLDIPTEAIV